MMNKPVLTLFFVTVLGIISFLILTYTRPSQAYEDLEEQFNIYLANDLTSDAKFIDYMNDLTLMHASENVTISYEIDQVNVNQSGVIVGIDGINVYVLSYNHEAFNDNDIDINIIDFKNRIKSAEIIKTDGQYDVVLLRFRTFDVSELTTVKYADLIPIENEFISSISNYNGISSYVMLGIFKETISEGYYALDMQASQTVLGSSVYNANHEIIGIRVLNNDDIVILSIEMIKEFIESSLV